MKKIPPPEIMRPVIKKMLEESWDIKKGEKILIISDSPSVEDFISKPLNLIESMLQRNLLVGEFTKS